MQNSSGGSTYRWYILGLATLTNTLAVAMPSMCMSVLFKEIAGELKLDLVQVGLIWGIGSLPGIVTVLLGGAMGDRFGPRRVLAAACLLAGLAGALRGLSGNYLALMAAMFMFGALTPAIPMNTFKTCGLWFPRRQMGLASGVLSMGMALGFMLGSILSATFLSPWLGGWRHVLLLYGAMSMVLCIPWVLSRPVPHVLALSGSETRTMPLRQTLAHVVRIRRIWLLGLAIFGIGGCIQGTLGYLPLYLRGLGWPEASADGALAAFHTVSMICVIPIALWSDKRGSRKKVLIPAALMVTMGVSLLSVVNGLMVWVAVCMAGLVRDGFMAVFMTMIIETDEIGPAYAGTATGFVMVFSGIGSLLAPPLGNGLATTAPGLPFLFWAVMTGIGLIGLYSAKERSVERSLVIQPSEV